MSIRASIANWLLRSEQKSNPAFAHYASADGRLPQPVHMTGSPSSMMKEGYKGSATAYKCISYIARNAAEIKIKLYADDTCKREITSDPILDLLKRPNADDSQYDFLEQVYSYILTTGNAYMYGLRIGQSGPPQELWSLRPDQIEIVPNGRHIERYDYKISEPPKPLDPRLVAHTKFFNPDDNLYGLSPIQVAAIFLDMNAAYNKWNLALTQNSATPPGAWIVPTIMEKRSRDTLEDKLNKKYQGAKNAGRIPVLDGDLKFMPTGIPPAQMAWLEARTSNDTQIASIYSLMPQLVGNTEASTDNNMDAAKYAGYTEAIFPLSDKLMGSFNRWLVPMFGKSSKFLAIDKQSVETIQKIMQAQEDAKAERWTKVWLAGGMMLADYQDKIGIEPDPNGKIYRIKDLLIAQDDLEQYAEQCLTSPMEQTLPVPEGTPPPTTVEGSLQKPPALPSPKKSLDNNGVYQPDNLASQLSQLKGQGVTEVTWHVSPQSAGCDICMKNNDVTVELGQPFPSGHILPVAHPNCECTAQPLRSGGKHQHEERETKSVDDASRHESLPFVAHKETVTAYREFRRRYQ